jgi:ABC-2 type transport system ATP-binding protein
MMTTTERVIRTEGLSKRFGGVQAVDKLNLEVPEGAVFALLGPNGAGKTTTIKILLGILRANTGSAEVLGVDTRRLGPVELARIGYVSENRQLPEWMTVGQFMAYSKAFYPAWSDSDAAGLVRAYELPLDRRLKDLSRGMRIKAALAGSLAYRPRLLILDEPFGGLDVLVREQLIESILDRTPELTVLLASHDLGEIESFATHAAYLHQGRIEFLEEMGALYQRFREVEVVGDDGTASSDIPPEWLNADRSSTVLRFTHSRWDLERSEAEIRRHFPGAREIVVRGVSLRTIFVALARSARVRR